jgi:hydrogenase maturation protease
MEFAPMIERLALEKTCIVGMGNYLRNDDAVGLFIVDGIMEKAASGAVTVMNVEDVLENYVFEIAGSDCDNVLIIDAVESGAEVGAVFFGSLSDFNESANNYSTHKLSLVISGKILEEHGKAVWLLGIEVRDTDFGRGLSDRVKESACFIRDILGKYITSDHKEFVYEY